MMCFCSVHQQINGIYLSINLIKFNFRMMLAKFHPLAKKIAILVIAKVTILWIFFKIIPVEKIRLTTAIVANHFLND